MATVTLTADEDWSSISGSVASSDTIDLDGFELTFDAQPSQTGVQVTSPGTGGTCVFSVAVVIPTWDFFAGTARMITTLPVDCEIGIAKAGTAYCINANLGRVGEAIGSDTASRIGVNSNIG